MPGSNGWRTNLPAYSPAPGNGCARGNRSQWGIVLAGGEGARMSPAIRSWCGAHHPKQYCTFVGSRSMYSHTIDRAVSIVPADNVVSVIGRGHRKYFAGSEDGGAHGLLLEQPDDRGTATAVFLSVAYVLALNPEATVLILPSGHFVLPEDRFCGEMRRALELAETHRGQIVLAGAIPDRRNEEYVWIEPGEERRVSRPAPAGPAYVEVARFRGKPGAGESRALLGLGALWNTAIVAARAKTLWALGRQLQPEMMHYCDAFLTVLRAVRERRLDPGFEARAIDALYRHVASLDFDKEILQRASMHSVAMRMEGVYWRDWQQPQQVADSLALLGRRPPFDSWSRAHVAAPPHAGLARVAGKPLFTSMAESAVSPRRSTGA